MYWHSSENDLGEAVPSDCQQQIGPTAGPKTLLKVGLPRGQDGSLGEVANSLIDSSVSKGVYSVHRVLGIQFY